MTVLAGGEFERTFLNVPKAELGGLIKEYIAECNHSDWEGFTTQEKHAISSFLRDILLYWEHSEKDFATKRTTTNPVD